VRILLAGALCVAAALAQNTSKVYTTADRPRALALIGDRYHSPVYIRDNLAPALLRENIPVTLSRMSKRSMPNRSAMSSCSSFCATA